MTDATTRRVLPWAQMGAVSALSACLCLGILSLGLVLLRAPATAPDLRARAITGDWRLAHGAAHYDLARYHYQIGFGYLQADAAPEVSTGASADVALSLGPGQAAAHFRKSLSLAPGRAAAWTGLAWAELLDGNEAAALRAIATSWALAPHSVGEAPERLAFADLLLANGLGIEKLRPHARAIERDFRVLALHRPAAFATISGQAPEIAALARAVRP